MSNLFGEWYTKPVRVSRLSNDSPGSDATSYEAPVDLMGQVEEKIQLVRDGQGVDIVSTLTLYLPLAAAPHVNAGARIELVGSQDPITTALAVAVSDEGDELDGVTVVCS